VQLAALIFNDLQRLEVWKIPQCLCRDATQLIVLQHPIIRKKKTLLKKKRLTQKRGQFYLFLKLSWTLVGKLEGLESNMLDTQGS